MVGVWHGHGMESMNQTRPHCVNQMGKTYSKPLAAQHAMSESAFTVRSSVAISSRRESQMRSTKVSILENVTRKAK